MFSYKILALVLVAICPMVFGQFANRAVLYDRRNQQGGTVPLISSDYPNLDYIQFNERAQSVCVSGVWIFYEHPNYNVNGGYAEYVHGTTEKPSCVNFDRLGGKVSSARLAGDSKHYRRDTLTFYSGTVFTGPQEFTTVDTPELRTNVRGKVSSIIVTGATPWTVYTGTNYRGTASCVYPGRNGPDSPAMVADTNELRIQRGAIQSARKGCNRNNRG